MRLPWTKKPKLNTEEGLAYGYKSAMFQEIQAVNDDLTTLKGIDIYTKMQNDPDVKVGLFLKCLGVLQKGWEIEGENKEQVEFLEKVFNGIEGNFFQVLKSMLSTGLATGLSIIEKVYALEDGKIVYSNLKPKNPTLYTVKVDDYNNVTGLYQSYSRQPLTLEKFTLFTYDSQYGSPNGLSDLRAAYRYFWFKTKFSEWWAIWLEKYGIPFVLGKVPKGTSKTVKQDLLSVLSSIKTETAMVVESDQEVEIIYPDGSGVKSFTDALEFCGKQIIRSILGQTLTTDEGQRSGSLALGKVHQDIYVLHLKYLKQMVESFVQDTWIKELIDLNFSTVKEYPRFVLPLEERDLAELSESFARLTQTELIDPRESWIREYLGLPEREEFEEPLHPEQLPMPPKKGVM